MALARPPSLAVCPLGLGQFRVLAPMSVRFPVARGRLPDPQNLDSCRGHQPVGEVVSPIAFFELLILDCVAVNPQLLRHCPAYRVCWRRIQLIVGAMRSEDISTLVARMVLGTRLSPDNQRGVLLRLHVLHHSQESQQALLVQCLVPVIIADVCHDNVRCPKVTLPLPEHVGYLVNSVLVQVVSQRAGIRSPATPRALLLGLNVSLLTQPVKAGINEVNFSLVVPRGKALPSKPCS
mmetsp:Transcript_767/g.1394  ORF Transcript_767/g.1394 Transcript_767/m.1394 type:complete len:236 (+) Transcript_767:377-1084(+)